MKFFPIARLLAASTLFLLTLFIFSCQKENHTDNNTTPVVSETDASVYADEATQAEGSFDDLDEIAQVTSEEDDYAATEGRSGSGRYFPTWAALRTIIGNCGTVTVSPEDGSFPKTITVDFGDSCVGADMKVRSGQINIHITAPRRKPGSVVTITLVNYSLNRTKIEGTRIVSNVSTGPTLRYSSEIVGGKVTFANGHGYTLQSSKLKEQIAGQATSVVLDNVFSITGTSDIVFTGGASVHLETIDPLIKKVICPWRSDGTVKATVNETFKAKLDYGFPNNGDCDRKALLTWNGGNSQKVILLP